MKGWIKVTGYFVNKEPLFIQVRHIVSVGVELVGKGETRTQIFTVESSQPTIVEESVLRVMDLIKEAWS